MSDESSVESIPLTAQVVLLGVAELTREDETPVQTHDLRRHCQQQLPAVDTEVVGTITEATSFARSTDSRTRTSSRRSIRPKRRRPGRDGQRTRSR